MQSPTLQTTRVLLRLLQPEDKKAFHQLAQDEEMWQYFTLNLSDDEQLQKWMDAAFADHQAGTRIPFTIIEKSSGSIAGSMSIGNISVYDQRAEIGWSWLGKEFRGTDINRHAKYSMMKHIFDELNFERLEFKTDVLNERARQGLRKIGALEEGILRSHMKMWNNRRRTSIYYSILKNEWPDVKQRIFKDIEDENH